MSSNQDYMRDNLSIFIALAPVTNLKHCGSTLLDIIAFNVDLIQATAQTLGIYELFPYGFITTFAGRLICGTLPDLCKFGISFFTDTDPNVDSTDRLEVYTGHFPAGTSLRCLAHYGQIINAGKFQRYDYGYYDNKKHYGQHTPPEIDLTHIHDIPVALFRGSLDDLADHKDTEWLAKQM